MSPHPELSFFIAITFYCFLNLVVEVLIASKCWARRRSNELGKFALYLALLRSPLTCTIRGAGRPTVRKQSHVYEEQILNQLVAEFRARLLCSRVSLA
jgi:hypothetical protein